MRTICYTLFLVVFVTIVSAQNDQIDNQIIVRFQPNAVNLPTGMNRSTPDSVSMPANLRTLFKEIKAIEFAKATPDFKSIDTLRILEDGRILRLPDYTNLFVITLPSGSNRDEIIKLLNNSSEVLNIEKNQRGIFRDRTPRDQHFSRQWALKNDGTTLQGSGTPGADIKSYLDLYLLFLFKR